MPIQVHCYESVNTDPGIENIEESMEVGKDNFDTYPSNDVCTHKSQTEENDYQCLIF